MTPIHLPTAAAVVTPPIAESARVAALAVAEERRKAGEAMRAAELAKQAAEAQLARERNERLVVTKWIDTPGAMTLRDYFAGQALIATTIKHWDESGSTIFPAETAYQIADAMLAEREKKGTV